MWGMPRRRGRSISGAPKSVKPKKIEAWFFRENHGSIAKENQIAITLDHIFNRDRDRYENFQSKV